MLFGDGSGILNTGNTTWPEFGEQRTENITQSNFGALYLDLVANSDDVAGTLFDFDNDGDVDLLFADRNNLM